MPNKRNWTKGFHLTVNKDGLVSLWDTPRSAKSGMMTEGSDAECYLLMKLTVLQKADLINAQAKTNKVRTK